MLFAFRKKPRDCSSQTTASIQCLSGDSGVRVIIRAQDHFGIPHCAGALDLSASEARNLAVQLASAAAEQGAPTADREPYDPVMMSDGEARLLKRISRSFDEPEDAEAPPERGLIGGATPSTSGGTRVDAGNN